jgi:hypothetical protein
LYLPVSRNISQAELDEEKKEKERVELEEKREKVIRFYG